MKDNEENLGEISKTEDVDALQKSTEESLEKEETDELKKKPKTELDILKEIDDL